MSEKCKWRSPALMVVRKSGVITRSTKEPPFRHNAAPKIPQAFALRKLFFALIPVFFVSCLGVSSQVKINNNGSGTFVQEYRVSHQLQNMGNIGENEGSLPLPSLKEDMERTVARIPGLHLVSYTTREDEKDLIIKAELAFDSPDALAAFMGSEGRQLKFDVKNRKINLHFDAGAGGDESFKGIMIAAFSGYNFSISLSAPGQVKAAWFDENRKSVQAYPGTCSVRNNTLEYTVPMSDLVYLKNSLDLEISW